jgi:allantoinase
MNMRDLVGYGALGSKIFWPNKARIAVSFIMNYEEGSELSPIHGDLTAETYGGEFPLVPKPQGMRNLSMESIFEYGSRSGLWRLLRLFDAEKIPLTIFATGLALTLNPEFCSYLQQKKHEIAGHGWRWIDYSLLPREEEKQHITQTLDAIKNLTGFQPRGWYTGRRSENTRSLLKEIPTLLYDSDSYADDAPYVEEGHLIIPYTLDCNDFRYTTSPGFSTGRDFSAHLQATFNYLYQENRGNMMSVGLHPRISGRPGRCHAVKEFLDYIKKFPDVWITRRIDIAEYFLNLKNAVES